MIRSPFIYLGIIFVLFLVVRAPGLSLPYHQDEWKTAVAVERGGNVGFLTHPPLTQGVYVLAERVVGSNHLRLVPYFVSALSLFLLYAVVVPRAGVRAALLAGVLYTVSFYSILASHMVDTDGALLPFFFLLALYCFDRAHSVPLSSLRWYFALFAVLLCGMMVKLSFILVLVVLAVEYLFINRGFVSRVQLLRLLGWSTLFIFSGSVLLLLVDVLHPDFRLAGMLDHALYYVFTPGRSYSQIFIQFLKVTQYLSPLLLAPLLFFRRSDVDVVRPFILYLVTGFFFYFVLFDFSHGALDKYLMFSIVPLSVLSGLVFSRVFTSSSREVWRAMPLMVLVILSVGLVNVFPHAVFPLHPKGEWFNAVMQGQWNFLTPFTGGSGPLGFYVSFLFIAISFIVSFGSALFARLGMVSRVAALTCILGVGVFYNAVFAFEYQFGFLHGSAPRVLASTLSYIEKSSEIDSIVTYNDTGAYELTKLGKYADRFYAAPQHEQNHKNKFADYVGSVLVIEMPRLYRSSFYGEWLSRCTRGYSTESRRVSAEIYTCGSSS